jgi:hypothetical protein
LFVDDVSSEKKKKKKKKKHEENGEADVTMDTTVSTSHDGIYCMTPDTAFRRKIKD